MLNSNKGVGGGGGKSLNSSVVKPLLVLSLPSLPTHLLPPLPSSHGLSGGLSGLAFPLFFPPPQKGKIIS